MLAFLVAGKAADPGVPITISRELWTITKPISIVGEGRLRRSATFWASDWEFGGIRGFEFCTLRKSAGETFLVKDDRF